MKENLERLMQGKSISIEDEFSKISLEGHIQMPGVGFMPIDYEHKIDEASLNKYGFQSFRVEEIGKIAVCKTNIKVNKEPLTHAGSSAKYYWEFKNGNDTWYGCAIPPNKETGEDHFHTFGEIPAEDQEEFYRVPFGALQIRHHENSAWEDAPPEFKVNTGIFHRVKSRDEGAFVTIITRNGELHGEKLKHVRLSAIGRG